MSTNKGVLTPRGAFLDLTWIFNAFVGAPTVLALLQIIQSDFRLSSPFQWIVDSYNSATQALADIIEPIFQPIVDFINSIVGIDLVIGEHWRPIFLLWVIIILSVFRTDQSKLGNIEKIFLFIIFGLFALIFSLLLSLIPLHGHWAYQGLIAVAFATLFSLPLYTISDKKEMAVAHGILSLFGFGLTVLLSFAFGLKETAFIATFTLVVMLVGFLSLASGLYVRSANRVKFGLTVIGGFILASLVVIADSFVKG